MYVVVTCPACGRGRILQEGPATTTCPHCGRRHETAAARVHGRFEALPQAQAGLGVLNASAAGDAAGVPVPRERPRAGDRVDRALDRARSVTAQNQRALLAADGLTDEFGRFDEAVYVEAMARLGIAPERARDHLRRLVESGAVHEPAAGQYATP